VNSWEVLRDAIEKVTVKAVASKLKISNALVYKWCQEPSRSNRDSSGARNPLDRIHMVFELTGDPRIINWLCHKAGGFFVQNPPLSSEPQEEQLLDSTQRFVNEFGAMLSAVSRSISNDGRITTDEAATIRQCWEQLKSSAERFVNACERGQFTGEGLARDT
jgi:hypothetical protein